MSVKLKRYNKKLDYSYAIGVFPTLELLHARAHQVDQVLLSSQGETNQGIQEIKAVCEKMKIPWQINDRAINVISPKENSYAIGVYYKFQDILEQDNNHVVLVNPGNMGNLGTIIRSMLGFGITNLAMIRPAVDIDDPKVVRASMGAFFRLKFSYFDDFATYQGEFQRPTYPFMLDAKFTLDKVQPDSRYPFSLVFGNESSGLDTSYHQVGTTVVIPHLNTIDSLNLAVAVSIACYEFSRKNGAVLP